MILRRYGSSLHSVAPNFDSKALTEIGFRKDNERSEARDEFEAFFHRDGTFALGVCNGCQMFAELAVLIPGAQDWPRFADNQSERFEARLSQVEVLVVVLAQAAEVLEELHAIHFRQ